MSRDINGTYSLPVGNPVVNATPITPDWANTTLADIAQALTNSLDRTGGGGGMAGPLNLQAGSAAAPSLRFSSDTDTGLFSYANNVMSVAAGGQEIVRFGQENSATPFFQLFGNGSSFAWFQDKLSIKGFQRPLIFIEGDTTNAVNAISDLNATIRTSATGIVFRANGAGSGFPFNADQSVSTDNVPTMAINGIYSWQSAVGDGTAGGYLVIKSSAPNPPNALGITQRMAVQANYAGGTTGVSWDLVNGGASFFPLGAIRYGSIDTSTQNRSFLPGSMDFYANGQYYSGGAVGVMRMQVVQDVAQPYMLLGGVNQFAGNGNGVGGGIAIAQSYVNAPTWPYGQPATLFDGSGAWVIPKTTVASQQIGSVRLGWFQFGNHLQAGLPIATQTTQAEFLRHAQAAGQNTNGADILSCWNQGYSVYLGGLKYNVSGFVVISTPSDERMKQDIIDHSSQAALQAIEGLRLRRFAYKVSPDVPRIGFIAQEVRATLPEVVGDTGDPEAMLSLDTSALIPYLVGAIQQLAAKVRSLQ